MADMADDAKADAEFDRAYAHVLVLPETWPQARRDAQRMFDAGRAAERERGGYDLAWDELLHRPTVGLSRENCYAQDGTLAMNIRHLCEDLKDMHGRFEAEREKRRKLIQWTYHRFFYEVPAGIAAGHAENEMNCRRDIMSDEADAEFELACNRYADEELLAFREGYAVGVEAGRAERMKQIQGCLEQKENRVRDIAANHTLPGIRMLARDWLKLIDQLEAARKALEKINRMTMDLVVKEIARAALVPGLATEET